MDKKENTVVLFPQLSERYIDQGFLALKEREFEEALRCFEILRQYNAETEQTELASVICLLELKRIEESKKQCEKLLETGTVLFGDILETYVTILVQTNDYEGVIQTVEEVLQTKELLPEQKEKLAQLALFAQGMLGGEELPPIGSNFELNEFANELFSDNFGQQLRAINGLLLKDLDKALPALQKFLLDDKQHPYLKTSILYKMVENKMEKEVEVEKFGETITVIPAQVGHDEEQSEKIIHILSNRLENDYPDIFKTIITYWREMQTSIFPFPLLMNNPKVWAAVLERIGRKRFGLIVDEEELMKVYHIHLEEFHIAYQWFLRVEKEGYFPV
ncbi:hypothetical protein ACQVUL_14800 [Bacillus cytotoxicus]|uniref:TPR repeat-containing protein n=1 Tax=Bacillus cytotoxicus (strain DSM 22905 / CIP 110041 / 391-98 / NVH 391-98) TaxID=315749 RepID=A7GTF3_BACCN|nr:MULTISPECIES: hypothetical protein [Bacillus cereus group]ABS23411.1 conserved hypothetical protein [Bacillus cytotoxicus NVH 391-98]AWC46037.1 hypothetical protein CG479_016945 [Bacillus cytotoxicus]MDH2864471.1 hypothetical protein [Bacillus cytotoxicus]MDH2883900.1 hypothetical protein [Bacillus cytotoxicus]NZD33094.1 hypothetical protein [Bacillus cytotoxicus]